MTIGVLLTNLGTPTAPTAKALRKYLAEFLWDPRVVEIPRPIWWLILNFFVLPLRPKRSAKLYQKIWTAGGSPLLVNSSQLAERLELVLNSEKSKSFKVALGMRYGEPSIAHALNELHQHDIQQIIVLPLYPQYSAATTASTFDAVARAFSKKRYLPELHFISEYYNDPDYIVAIADSIRAHWLKHGSEQHLLFSFHGLPKRCVELGDPYEQQCKTTARLVVENLQLSSEKYSVVFQSRFGAAEWLQPYCDATLRSLPEQGKKNVAVVCPGFAVDCLETLEEIAKQNREIFMQAGGEKFDYIPALNDSVSHVALLAKLITQSD